MSAAGAVGRSGAKSNPSFRWCSMAACHGLIFQACLLLLALIWRHVFCWHFPSATVIPTMCYIRSRPDFYFLPEAQGKGISEG